MSNTGTDEASHLVMSSRTVARVVQVTSRTARFPLRV